MAQKLMELEDQTQEKEAFDKCYHARLYGDKNDLKLQFIQDTSLPGEFFLDIQPSVPNLNKKMGAQGEKIALDQILDAKVQVDE